MLIHKKQKQLLNTWGAKEVFTTPKSTRGTWYYKEKGKVKKFSITAHTVNGLKLYKRLKGKTGDKIDSKFAEENEKIRL